MTTPLLDLDGLKSLFTKGMKYAQKKFSSPFFTANDKLCDYQLELANKAQDLTTFMNAVWIGNQTFTSAFDDPQSICDGCELKYTGVQFGVGNVGWYFIYGVSGNYVYNITLFRVEVAPPSVVDFDRSEAVRWYVMGGYGEIGGDFINIQNEAIYMKYNQPTYSTFSLVGKGNFVDCTFFSQFPMQFVMNLAFTDTSGASHTLGINLSANTRPLKNYPNACLCGPGAGTFYYSYTDVTTTMSVNGVQGGNGKGWIDHQLMKFGPLNGWYLPALQTAMNVLKPRISSGWLWFSIVDEESGIQYMLSHSLSDFYEKTIKVGNNISIQLVNVYKEGVAYIYPTDTTMDARQTDVVLLETFNRNGINLPAKYKITLPGGKRVIAKMISGPNVYPNALAPCENVGYLYDESGERVIGIVLLEANLYLTNRQLSERNIQQAGGDMTDTDKVNLVLEGFTNPQTMWQKTLAFLVFLYPIWVLLLVLWFVYRQKEDRHIRLMFSILVVVIGYVILNSPREVTN